LPERAQRRRIWLPDSLSPPPKDFAERFPQSFRGRLLVLVRLRDFWSYLPTTPDCDQENLIEQLKNGVRVLRAPADLPASGLESLAAGVPPPGKK
jgi:hypothetical protein